MTAIGYWIDLGVYYAGSDGNVWYYSRCAGYGGNWSNNGPIDEFRQRFAQGRYRGKLLETVTQ